MDALQKSLADHQLQMVPVVLSELLSDSRLPPEHELALMTISLLEITPGFWSRAGKLRARLIGLGYRPRLADTLIAQTCLDHGALLMTRDRDFSPFARHAHLKLWP